MEIEIVYIKGYWNPHKLQVSPETRIKDLKIEKGDDENCYDFSIFYFNKTGIDLHYDYIQELDDENTLSYYNIPNNSTIFVLYKMHSFSFNPSNEISDFKCTFTIENEKGEKYDITLTHTLTMSDLAYLISVHDQVKKFCIRLFFNGIELKYAGNLHKLIEVPNGSTIQYKISEAYKGGSMPVRLKTLTGKIYDLMIDPTETTRELKLQIEEIIGLQPESQRIIFNGKQLDDDEMLQDYSVSKDSILHLVLPGRPQMWQ